MSEPEVKEVRVVFRLKWRDGIACARSKDTSEEKPDHPRADQGDIIIFEIPRKHTLYLFDPNELFEDIKFVEDDNIIKARIKKYSKSQESFLYYATLEWKRETGRVLVVQGTKCDGEDRGMGGDPPRIRIPA